MKSDEIKKVVKEKYSEIARQALQQNVGSCCDQTGCCGELEFKMIGNEYITLNGYNPDADLGLGCGIPTQFAQIKNGYAVLDLGCGAGNDCFVAHAMVGEKGKVVGLDFSDEMLKKAAANAIKLGYQNIEFVKGDIEEMPFPDNSFDVVISNCVLNLVPNKQKAFGQIFRVIKPGGHFCISDVVTKGKLPDNLQKATEMYVGCVAGAIELGKYLEIIYGKGFQNVIVHKQKEIEIPAELLKRFLSDEEISTFRNDHSGIYSITVTGYK